MYIHELPEWPGFSWDKAVLADLLAQVQYKQGRLLGKMESLGFKIQEEANLGVRTRDVLKTSEIEGDLLDPEQVRSSLARRLQMRIPGLRGSSQKVDGIVEMTLDATKNYAKKLTRERLFSWHTALFAESIDGAFAITVGNWRKAELDPMQVVSGPLGGGRQRIHFEAPPAKAVPSEMRKFLLWFEKSNENLILKSGVAHLWFLTIHPFEDGNGRIARSLADMLLARSDKNSQRFYSMSAQISAERKYYYEILEKTQKNSLDITKWLIWYMGCLERAIDAAEALQESVLRKARFWEKANMLNLNERQKKVLNRMLDGFEGNLTSSKWAKIAKCSQDTAHRDILELIAIRVLKKEQGGGRSTSYNLNL